MPSFPLPRRRRLYENDDLTGSDGFSGALESRLTEMVIRPKLEKLELKDST